ncbi:sigma-54-dependent Fis family transcriptional regulator, partial [Virgibacillus halodenitrificans]|nr:sigma-54-dependent Fis family transcriptional regulator [Virgibacillus halodenitrificans]
MKRVLIVGAGKGGSVLLNILRATKRMHIVAIVDKDIHAEGLSLARKFNISCDNDWKQWVDKDIDIIIEATGDDKVLDEIIETRSRKTVVIPGTVAYIIAELFNEKEELLKE